MTRQQMSCQKGHPAEYILVDTKRKNKGFLQRIFGTHNSKKLVLERLKELRPSLFAQDEEGLKWLAYIPPRMLTHYCENMDNLRLETLVNAASDLLSQQQKECRRQQSLKHAVEKQCRVYKDKLQQVATIVRNVLESYGVKHPSHNLEAWRSGESLGREGESTASSLYGSEDWVDFSRPCFDRLRACLEEVISICDTSKVSLGIEAFADEAYMQSSEYVSEVSSLTSSSTVPLKKVGKFSQEKKFVDGNVTNELLWTHNRVSASHAYHYSDPLASTSYYWPSPKMSELEQVHGHDMEMHLQDNRSQCLSTQSSRYQPSYKSNSSGKSALKTRMPCPDVLLYGDNVDFANCNSTKIYTKDLSVSDRQVDEMKYINSLEEPVSYSAGDSWSFHMTATHTV
ncbi:hypothetical protein GpartN1_g5228.t1 [Galdieria partita]|uniref:Uncharacterized protein n=1 Tax=Galdieria partita TaxID=83374 RepID=A0A9C7PSJ5_9RHOD|nr:hypothetical protein GpartN1_g973.t1 [Galdieria partita]GJQ13437.1 hypothetical protein GpartN1_g5228.t1 [Galdieria partita]